MSVDEQFILLFSGLTGLFDNVPLNKINAVEEYILKEFNEVEFYSEEGSIQQIQQELTESIQQLLEKFN